MNVIAIVFQLSCAFCLEPCQYGTVAEDNKATHCHCVRRLNVSVDQWLQT